MPGNHVVVQGQLLPTSRFAVEMPLRDDGLLSFAVVDVALDCDFNNACLGFVFKPDLLLLISFSKVQWFSIVFMELIGNT